MPTATVLDTKEDFYRKVEELRVKKRIDFRDNAVGFIDEALLARLEAEANMPWEAEDINIKVEPTCHRKKKLVLDMKKWPKLGQKNEKWFDGNYVEKMKKQLEEVKRVKTSLGETFKK